MRALFLLCVYLLLINGILIRPRPTAWPTAHPTVRPTVQPPPLSAFRRGELSGTYCFDRNSTMALYHCGDPHAHTVIRTMLLAEGFSTNCTGERTPRQEVPKSVRLRKTCVWWTGNRSRVVMRRSKAVIWQERQVGEPWLLLGFALLMAVCCGLCCGVRR